MGQGLFEFLARCGDGGASFFPRLLRAAQADRQVQRTFEQPLHDEARQATDDRQIRNQRRQLGAKLAHDLLGQRRLRRLPAGGAHDPMTPIFGNVRLKGRQVGDLMSSRVADLIARVQPLLAMTTRVGDEIHDRVHTLGGDERARVAWMTRLPTGLPSTLGAAPPFAWASGQSIGGRRLRGRRRVLPPQGELPLQISNLLGFLGDLFRLVGVLLTEPFILASQSLDLARVTILDRLRSLIVVRPAWLSHATFMADSRQKYKYGILDLWDRDQTAPDRTDSSDRRVLRVKRPFPTCAVGIP